MKRFKRLPVLLGACAVLAGGLRPAFAHEAGPPPAAVYESPAVAAGPLGMDPVMRALLIGMAARMLTEAARSPDPMTTLGDSVERILSSALRDPASARMLEDWVARAFKEVPPELHAPLVLFAGSMLANMRREMQNARPYD